jgi:hypothetical protein
MPKLVNGDGLNAKPPFAFIRAARGAPVYKIEIEGKCVGHASNFGTQPGHARGKILDADPNPTGVSLRASLPPHEFYTFTLRDLVPAKSGFPTLFNC